MMTVWVASLLPQVKAQGEAPLAVVGEGGRLAVVLVVAGDQVFSVAGGKQKLWNPGLNRPPARTGEVDWQRHDWKKKAGEETTNRKLWYRL